MIHDGLIVGIDSGVTTSIAILNLRGELVGIRSGKDFSFSEMASFIIGFGKPTVFAADVFSPPANIQKLARTFGVRLISPRSNLGVFEKKRLAHEIKYRPRNRHEEDSIAAAVYVFRGLQPSFSKIESKVPPQVCEAAKVLLLTGRACNIMEAERLISGHTSLVE